MMRDSKIEVLCTYFAKVITGHAQYKIFREKSDEKNAESCRKKTLSWIGYIFREIAPERKIEKRFPKVYNMLGEMRNSLENGTGY